MKDLSVQLYCVVLNGNIEKWLEKDKADLISNAIKRGDKFVEIGGELINTFSVVGVFTASTMAEKNRRRNGEWQCEHGEWWRKDDKKCECDGQAEKERRRRASEIMKQRLERDPYLERS